MVEPGPGAVVAAGPRAAQRELFTRLDALLQPPRRRGEPLAPPVRVVVPSSALRRHLQEQLVRWRRGAVVGVRVQTLSALAREVLERAGQRPGVVGDALLPVMVERFARREGVLAGLAAFEEGYGTLLASVQDLLDAGLEVAHVEALEERLGEVGGEEAERAAAVVRVAAKAALALAAEGVERPAGVLARAAGCLRGGVELPARAVLVYGFADATALAADLLEALVGQGATVVMDLPPHPADPTRPDPGAAFTSRLRQRLGVGEGWTSRECHPEAAKVDAVVATDLEGEAREVARRVRRLLDGGVRPEGVGIVARDVLPYRDALARQLDRLAVPWSPLGVVGPWLPWARRVKSALILLRHGAEAPLEAFVAAAEGLSPVLALALAGAGVRRLGQLAGFLVSGGIAVPLASGAEGDEQWVRRRVVGRHEVATAQRGAREVVRLLAGWRDPSGLGEFRQLLDRLGELLGWSCASEVGLVWRGLLAEVSGSVPAATLLRREELCRLLEDAARERLRAAQGEPGGGVVVAPVMAVRGFTFEQLFVLGCNRGVFPRHGVQDPLLPDRMRALLLPLLPDLPLKGDPAAEERYLFAQLCAAAGRVTLSWRRQGEAGEALPLSPLLTPLGLTPVEAGGAPGQGGGPLPALDSARHLGLAGDGPALLGLWQRLGPGGSEAIAPARLAVVGEQDLSWEEARDRGPLDSLGPYLGLVGCRPTSAESLSVSWLEGLARCPWQTFLTRVLRLEPPLDPEAEVGELHAGLLGTALHRALALLLGAEEGKAGGSSVPPPTEGQLGAAALEAAAAVAREEGLTREAATLAVPRLAELLRVAHQLLWPTDEPVAVVGVEREGELDHSADGRELRVRFRADLEEATPTGPRLTDFKTGRNPFDQANSSSVTRAYLKAVQRGEQLQAAVYAAASGGVGRLLYLRPEEGGQGIREVAVGAAECRQPLARVLAALADLWATGTLFPRLESARDGQEPRACLWCPVREGCWRGDSGLRRRLALAAGELVARRRAGALGDPVAMALAGGWILPAGLSAMEDG